jgi:hypothetical protein
MDNSDTSEKSIRFGCGFIFGLFLFGSASIRYFFHGGELIALIALVPAIVIGLAAAKYGDSFWQWLSRNWRWWI